MAAPAAPAPLLTIGSESGIAVTRTLTVVTLTNNGQPAPITQTVGAEAPTVADNPAASAASNASILSSNSAVGASSVSAQSVSSQSAAARLNSATVGSVTLIPAPTSNSVTPTTESSPTSTSSNSSALSSSAPAATHASSDHRLANGTVAGIVIGVAVGLALLTFLATFLCMRRRGRSKDKGGRGMLATGVMGQHYEDSEPKAPLVSETTSGSTSLDNFLPQSADDKTVRNNVKITLDQVELHVENFYQNTSVSGSRPAGAELATFNSPYLSNSLAALLPKTDNRVLFIKHALAQFVTSCISATAGPDRSLLPEDFVLLPSAIQSASSSRSTKPGFSQSMSRWRVLTAYLRPNPSDDNAYIAHRDHQIKEMVLVFSRAFAPWQNPKYKDEDRVRSLSAILKDAAGLGIWMFSQPSDLQFQWPRYNDIGANMVAIAPALVKLTDERGQILSEPQVIFKMTAQKV